jgi:hypothetical protein
MDKLKIVVKLVPYFFSAAALLLSWLSYRWSRRLVRIENFLHFGAPEEIDMEIEDLKDRRAADIEAAHRAFRSRKLETESDFGNRGLIKSGALQNAVRNLEEGRDRQIADIERKTQLSIRQLEARKEHLAGL